MWEGDASYGSIKTLSSTFNVSFDLMFRNPPAFENVRGQVRDVTGEKETLVPMPLG